MTDAERIGLTLKKAKISRKVVAIRTKDEELRGTVEDLDARTLKLRHDGIFVPIREIEAVSYE
ncbi:hypothetical protein [Bartonella sp. CL29QHWL]|uniref:hypothetical protein n=1 Tax=Bartonella sp. CL29QHWL TaxID=3243522 RepID=UPI0035CF5718